MSVYALVDAEMAVVCAGQTGLTTDSAGQDVVKEQVDILFESTRDPNDDAATEETFTVQVDADFASTGNDHYYEDPTITLAPGEQKMVTVTNEYISGDWDLQDSFTIEVWVNVEKNGETGSPSEQVFYGLGPEVEFEDCDGTIDDDDSALVSPDASITDCTIGTNQVDVTATATVSVTVSFPGFSELPDEYSSTEALVELVNGAGQVFAEEWLQGVGERTVDITFSPTNAGVTAGDTLTVNSQLSNVSYI